MPVRAVQRKPTGPCFTVMVRLPERSIAGLQPTRKTHRQCLDWGFQRTISPGVSLREPVPVLGGRRRESGILAKTLPRRDPAKRTEQPVPSGVCCIGANGGLTRKTALSLVRKIGQGQLLVGLTQRMVQPLGVRPTSVAVDADGFILVADWRNAQVGVLVTTAGSAFSFGAWSPYSSGPRSISTPTPRTRPTGTGPIYVPTYLHN